MKQYLKSIIIGLVFLLVLAIIVFIISRRDHQKDVSYISYEINREIEINKIDNIEQLQIELDSVDKIIAYLNKNYILINKLDWSARELDEIINDNSLSLADFAYFTSYLLKEIDLEPGIIKYEADNFNNLLVIFRDNDLPKYITYTQGNFLMYHHGWSFNDLMKTEKLRLDISINRYAYFPGNAINFSEPISPYQWEYVDK